MDNFTKTGYSDYKGRMVVCAQCGYRFVVGDEAFVIKATDDIIHKDCFIDYSQDNLCEFVETIDF